MRWKMVAAVLPLALTGCGLCLRGQPGCQPPLGGWQDVATPVYEPPPPPYFPQMPVSDFQLPHIDIDPSPMVTGTLGCPFIPLPGTNVCVVPMP